MKILRLKYFSKKEKDPVNSAIISAGVVGAGMKGIDIVDSNSGLSKQLNMAFGISRPGDSMKDKLKKKAVNEIYNTKPESNTGRFNIFARLKNKLKDKKLATLRGSKEFIEPLEKELNQRSTVDKDYKQLIEKHTKDGAEKNKLVIKDLEKLVDENNKSIEKIKKEKKELEKLRITGKVAKGYTKAVNWTRDNWNDGTKGKSKVAAIPLGVGALAAYKTNNKNKKEREGS